MKNSAEDILQQFKNKINLSDYLSNFISLEKEEFFCRQMSIS